MKGPLTVSPEIVETMIELANRDAVHEAAMLRVARAGEIVEVEKHILRLRKYMKSHQPAAKPAAKPKPSTRRRKSGQSGSDGASQGADTSTVAANASN